MALLAPLYGTLGRAITPLLVLWLEARARRGKEDPFRLGERFGRASVARPQGQLVWLHAASVGETQSVLTLLRSILQEHPALHVVLTTGTVTSAALVAKQGMPRVIHQFVPVDTAPAVARFLAHWKPSLALWVESELWPQLLWQTSRLGVPMLLINARISEATYRRWRRWPWLAASLLRCFTRVYAGSEMDAVRLRELGARKVLEVGNLKYDAAPLPVDTGLCVGLAQQIAGRRIIVAASTHPEEERLIAQIHRQLARDFPTLLTILVPRHAARGDALGASLRSEGYPLAQRSQGEAIRPTTELYLADTMGELGSFYSVAELVFMGGSLVAHGGQNPLEPARFHKPILTGPYTHNFPSIIEALQAVEGIAIAADAQQLEKQLHSLLTDPTQARAMAEHAATWVAKAQGASAIVAQDCAALLEGRPE
jgi:3-deoxy-D-manno-octulosonic-acid transferase